MKKVEVISQGVVHSQPHDRFGYYGWPSIARLDDGTLVVGASGMRMQHVCPWGKTTLFYSKDDGKTWTPPVVVNDTPLDDRDVGLLALGGNKLLVNWFNLEAWYFGKERGIFRQGEMSDLDFNISNAMIATFDDELNEKWKGSYTRVSEDGGVTWGDMHRVPVTTPHGPALMADGSLLFLGKGFARKESDDIVGAYRSTDDGATWEKLGEIPFPSDTKLSNFFEPHLLQLPSGRVLGLIRYQDRQKNNPHKHTFSIYQSWSDDNGATWSEAYPLDVSGSPPHIIRHSSGAIICAYARREEPFAELAMISRDEGETWDYDYTLREAFEVDIGYPASVELMDGSIFTIYYQKLNPGEKCSILYTHWKLP